MGNRFLTIDEVKQRIHEAILKAIKTSRNADAAVSEPQKSMGAQDRSNRT